MEVPTAAEPLPSSTVVVLRDGARALEVLLLQRAPRRDGQSGPWVFPGGKVEPDDRGHEGDETPGARGAAVRETREEAGLELDPAALVPVSRWITPELSPKRFDTWFFAVHAVDDVPIRVDGREIVDHRWWSADDALQAHAARDIALAPPTFVTVHWLLGHAEASGALSSLARGPFLTFRPRICPTDGGVYMLYPGDAGYEQGDPGRDGARHRIWNGPAGFEYQRTRS